VDDMQRIIISLIVFLILGTGCDLKLNTKIEDPEKRISNFFEEQTANSKIPGVQYVVVDSNSILVDLASGYADIQNGIKMKPHTTMMAYSMTKTFTALAILQLLDSGKIKLEDPVKKYLPYLPYSREITIRHLITHTSGIPNPIPLKWVHPANKHNEYNELNTLLKILAKHQKLSFDPGEKYLYSNLGYWLLGKIIEEISSLTFSEYMSQNIINKLPTNDNPLSFTISDPTNHAKGYLAKYSFFNLIKGFLIDDNLIGEYEQNWLHIYNHYANGPSFGGLIGCAESIAVFLQDQLKTRSSLIGEKTRQLFYTQQSDNSGNPIEMSLGWHIGYLNGSKYFYKEGGGGGYHCEMRIYPSQKTGSVIMVNCTNFNSTKYLNTLDGLVLSELM
jgi:D-alanyl-D-alanine carboxypeptidase